MTTPINQRCNSIITMSCMPYQIVSALSALPLSRITFCFLSAAYFLVVAEPWHQLYIHFIWRYVTRGYIGQKFCWMMSTAPVSSRSLMYKRLVVFMATCYFKSFKTNLFTVNLGRYTELLTVVVVWSGWHLEVGDDSSRLASGFFLSSSKWSFLKSVTCFLSLDHIGTTAMM